MDKRVMKFYPQSIPEFRWVELKSGSFMLQVRYISEQFGYTGKWMTVPSITEDEATKELQANRLPVQSEK